VASESVKRAVEQFLGYEIIETADDDANFESLGVHLAFDHLSHRLS
jgi:hypothetical protein